MICKVRCGLLYSFIIWRYLSINSENKPHICKLVGVVRDKSNLKANQPLQHQPNCTLQVAIWHNDDGRGLNEEENLDTEKGRSETKPPEKETVVQRPSSSQHHPSRLHLKNKGWI
jgi:hypothetical protein